MSVAIRGLSAAAAVALTFGIVTQPSGSAAQTSGHERAEQFSMRRLAERYLELYARALVPAG